jgi:hypothetical protein
MSCLYLPEMLIARFSHYYDIGDCNCIGGKPFKHYHKPLLLYTGSLAIETHNNPNAHFISVAYAARRCAKMHTDVVVILFISLIPHLVHLDLFCFCPHYEI